LPHLDDNRVANFAQGLLRGADLAEAEQHLDACEPCRRLLGDALRAFDSSATQMGAPHFDDAAANSDLKRGAQVGRYFVIAKLGSGGMGVVYSAYDPDLERKVALKLLLADSGLEVGEARTRLMREAQALARISHPNLLTIYDVGAFGEGVFLAMEHVDGGTLRTWLRKARRPWRALLKPFLAAGEGLSAAHAAGLVHRDFKPDNVLIAKDGRIRVSDFGLVRQPAGGSGRSVSLADLPVASQPWETPSTRAGVGTPRYMSPEQFHGLPVDARSDQFSFCVALYEALFAELPFEGNSSAEIQLSKFEGKFRPPPPNSRVPQRIRLALLRGLSPDPDRRFPSLDALLAVLRRDPSRSWQAGVAVAAAGVVVAVASSLVAAYLAAGQRSRLCRGAEAKLVGIWDAGAREAMRRAFVATGKPNAADVWQRTEGTLDRYAREWAAAHQDACEATRIRGEQSEELMDVRMACLSQRFQEFSSLTALFASADARVVEKAIDAAHALSPLEPCSAGTALANRVPPPADGTTRKRVDDLRLVLAHAKALRDAGKYPQGLAVATEAAASARTINYRPVEAEAWYALADAQDRVGRYKAAEESLIRSLAAAEAGRHDRAAAQAAVLLSYVVGFDLGRHPEGLSWSEVAWGKIERIGGDPELDSRLHNYVGAVRWDEADYDGAATHFARAVEVLGRAEGAESPQLAGPLNNLGLIYQGRADYSRAEAYYQQALTIGEKTYGPDSADTTPMISNLGDLRLEEGRPEEATAFHRRALRIYEVELGKDHPDAAQALRGLGAAFRVLGQFEEAEACQKRALRLREAASGPEHQLVVGPLVELGAVHAATGHYQEAEAEFRRAISILEKTQGPETPDLNEPLGRLGGVWAEQGRFREALVVDKRAVAAAEKLGANHPAAARALTGLGRDQLALGEPVLAAADLDRALKIREAHPTLPADLAETRFLLARALVSSKGDLARARRLAVAARDAYRGSFRVKELAAVERWLDRLPSN
jgi:eukaryotic-like serine/threonine-protein kinase